MSDIEKSFTFLHENIAQWLANIAEVEAKVVKMQAELAKVPARSLPMKRKTGSTESLRDLNAIMEEPSSSPAPPSSPLITRKRKPSIPSGNASGPSKYRSRMMIMVTYDGDVQKSFEQLVRAVGTGRNLLRKGKMAAKLEAMAALAGSDDDDDGDNDDVIMSKIGYRHRTGLSSMRTRATMTQTSVSDSSSTPVELFDSTDKELESAQSLCEKAAHQSLREGDCRKELEAVRKHFGGVQETAKQEVARYVARKEKEEKERAAAPPEPTIGTPTPTPAPAPIIPEPKQIQPVHVPIPSSTLHSSTQVIDIEVDDEEEEEDTHFVMPPIRLTSRV
ncbi:hypothetical protein P280DRAFT_513258 [Massarina eburnea CBS 473.64]|uniref:Uncharacterized protein n=1 Tax=Massarina eburnea CBS 473.64 TaxID=1395130 RepID=A0A6A6SDY4_9PLEO|nr:hypothetical protein P280DRAFT_513258 [Massarina eburnea CBS 473.64]